MIKEINSSATTTNPNLVQSKEFLTRICKKNTKKNRGEHSDGGNFIRGIDSLPAHRRQESRIKCRKENSATTGSETKKTINQAQLIDFTRLRSPWNCWTRKWLTNSSPIPLEAPWTMDTPLTGSIADLQKNAALRIEPISGGAIVPTLIIAAYTPARLLSCDSEEAIWTLAKYTHSPKIHPHKRSQLWQWETLIFIYSSLFPQIFHFYWVHVGMRAYFLKYDIIFNFFIHMISKGYILCHVESSKASTFPHSWRVEYFLQRNNIV